MIVKLCTGILKLFTGLPFTGGQPLVDAAVITASLVHTESCSSAGLGRKIHVRFCRIAVTQRFQRPHNAATAGRELWWWGGGTLSTAEHSATHTGCVCVRGCHQRRSLNSTSVFGPAEANRA